MDLRINITIITTVMKYNQMYGKGNFFCVSILVFIYGESKNKYNSDLNNYRTNCDVKHFQGCMTETERV